MKELELAQKRIDREVRLEAHLGADRVILAEDKWQALKEERKYKPKFLANTGLVSLDKCVDGFRKGQLIIVSGPPKQGKTSLCQTFTKSFVENKQKCLWFSYELSYEEVFEKFPMEKLDFYVPNYMESGNLGWVEDRVIESKQKYGTEIVFIDNLDFLRDPEVLKGISLNLSSYIGGIVQKVKRMAVEHDMVIFLMSHIRKNKWTTNDLPSSEELRDSGQIAQLADIVLMLMRKRAERGSEEVYIGNSAVLGVMENRHNGRTKKIHLEFEDKKYRESEYEGYNDVSLARPKNNW